MPDGSLPRTLRDADALRAAGLIGAEAVPAIAAVAARYAIAVTPAVAALIEAPDDPIARQYIPHPDEALTAPDELPDPTSDAPFTPIKGVVHRHPDRALLKPLLACPVYCRFCFRREVVGPDGGLLTEAELDAAIAWFAATPAVREVILTGGDPLMLSPRRLGDLLARLAALPHIEILRIHTRVPVANPARVTAALVGAHPPSRAAGVNTRVATARSHAQPRARNSRFVPEHGEDCEHGGDPLMLSPRRLGDLLARLAALPHIEILRIHTRVPVANPARVTAALVGAMDVAKPLFLCLHANHAREFSPAARDAIARITRAGIPVLGQSVLLAGVNDSEQALEDLFRAMLSVRMKPYYLHQLDLAPGTARFRVAPERGRAILRALRARITGLAWPAYVQEAPGGAGKQPIGPGLPA